MYEKLHRWAIEVNQNQKICNFEAQRSFIRDFGKSLYQSVDNPSSPLHSLQYVYFTRIFYPPRDEMGAYVRLHFFVEKNLSKPAETELDNRLDTLKGQGKVFTIKKEEIDGIEEAGLKGAKDFPELYYSYIHHISRMTVELFDKQRIDVEIDKILWTWTHNFFNLLRGYQVPVLEFDPGTVARSYNI